MDQKIPEDKDVLFLSVTALSLGTAARDGSYIKLIQRNTTIPTKTARVFTTIEDNQTSITLRIIQGESDDPVGNMTLGVINLHSISPASRGDPRIEVTFDIDAEGVLNVSARDLSIGKQVAQQITVGQVKTQRKVAEELAAENERRRKETEQPQIKNVRLYVKQPSDIFTDIPTIVYGSLPEGFVKGADEMLGFDGELIAYVKERGVFFPEDISNVEDTDMESFLSRQAESDIWDAYYATGSTSGKRYYLLVDFYVQPSVPLDTIEARRGVYLEYKKLLGELASQYALDHPTAQPGVIPNYIMTIADRRIRCKYGLSELDMVRIHGEAITNFRDIVS